MTTDYAAILARATQFFLMQLDGQPQMMHMGTSYLVHDMAKAIRELIAERDALVMAVATKHPGESRYETALRYIKEREQGQHDPADQTGCATSATSPTRDPAA